MRKRVRTFAKWKFSTFFVELWFITVIIKTNILKEWMQIAEHIWKFQALNAFNLSQLVFPTRNIKTPVFTKEKSLENESRWIGGVNFLETINSCGATIFEWKKLPSLPLTFELKRHRANLEKYTELLFKRLPSRLQDENKEETKKTMFRYSELWSQCSLPFTFHTLIYINRVNVTYAFF